MARAATVRGGDIVKIKDTGLIQRVEHVRHDSNGRVLVKLSNGVSFNQEVKATEVEVMFRARTNWGRNAFTKTWLWLTVLTSFGLSGWVSYHYTGHASWWLVSAAGLGVFLGVNIVMTRVAQSLEGTVVR